MKPAFKRLIPFTFIFIILPSSSFQESTEEIFLKKAGYYLSQDLLDKAIDLYLEVLKKDPYNFYALINLSSAYIKKGSFYEAYPYLKRLVRKYPERPESWINLAVCEIGIGDLRSAMKNLEKAEKLLDCPSFALYLHKGVIFSKMGKLEDAIRCYKKAELMNPEDPCLIFNIALAYDKKKDYKKAIIYYEMYLKKEVSQEEKRKVRERIEQLKLYLGR